MCPFAYPASRYEPSPLVDLHSRAQRERLSPGALKAFFNIMKQWGVRDEDARQLLGGVTNGPYYEMKKRPEGRLLEPDRLMRISYLIGIFKALGILHSHKLADEWVRLPNTNRIFAGMTPLAYMLGGGAPAMQTLRRLLDARLMEIGRFQEEVTFDGTSTDARDPVDLASCEACEYGVT